MTITHVMKIIRIKMILITDNDDTFKEDIYFILIMGSVNWFVA